MVKQYGITFLLLLQLTAFDASVAHAQTELRNFHTLPYILPADTARIRSQIRKANELRQTFPDSSLDIFKQVLQESKSHQYPYGVAYSLFGLGNMHSELGALQEALRYYLGAIAYCRDNQVYRQLIPILYNNMATVNDLLGDYEQAARSYELALQYKEQYPESRIAVSEIYLNLSIVFAKLSQLDKAMSYIDEAEKRHKNDSDYVFYCTLFNNKGAILYQLKELDKSKYYFERSLQLAGQHQQPNKEAEINIANIYYLQHQQDKALSLLRNLLADAKKLDPNNHTAALLLTGQVLYAQKQYKEALAYLLQASQESKRLHLPEKELTGYLYLSLVYRAIRDPWIALQYQDHYLALKDSMMNKEVVNNTNKLETRYRTAQKDKELLKRQLLIGNQEHALKKKNLWILTLSLSALLLSFLFFLLYRYNKQKQTAYNKQVLQQQEIEQLKAIMEGEEKERARLARELHDGIGGMLVSAKLNLGAVNEEYPGMAAAGKIEEVMSMLQNISSEVRRTVHNLMPDVLIRVGLEEALGIFCDEISAGSKMDIDIQFQGDFCLPKSWELLLYRMVQELIQNVAKHAQASYMAVLLRKDEEQLSITVEDNGIGFDVEEQSKGFGLQNLKFRVAALQGELSIMSAKGRNTTIFISFATAKIKELQDSPGK